jgi:DUF2892 family protein
MSIRQFSPLRESSSCSALRSVGSSIPIWCLLTAFAGLNMIQASVTGFCPAAIVFKKLGLRSGNAFS